MNIEQIKRKIIEETLISDVIANYLDIQKKGDGYISVCPFHDDSKPSLNINNKKKIYKCFACNAGGNSIYFVMSFNKINEIQAINEIISKLNLDIKIDNKITSNQSYQIKLINKEANEIFQAFLITEEGEVAYNYLRKIRNLSDAVIERFNIGYCLKGKNLSDYLIKKDFKLLDIEESNLISNNNGDKFDFFGGRITFPIKDIYGDTIGFSGRSLVDSSAKYLNTKENIVFKKSQILYNFSDAKRSILEKKQVIICEGFMDVIALHRIKCENVIAIMGVNLSDYHLKVISKLNSPIFTIFLDGDNAGVNATINIIKKLLARNIRVNIVYNNTKMDPDELLNNNKGDYLKSIINKPLSVIDFLIEKYLKDINNDNLSERIEKVFEVISCDSNSINTTTYINKLMINLKKFNLNSDNIIQDLNRYKNQHRQELVKNIQVSSVNEFSDYINSGHEETKNKSIFEHLEKMSEYKRNEIAIETMILKTVAFSLINKSILAKKAYEETFKTMAKYARSASTIFYAVEESYKDYIKQEVEEEFDLKYATKYWKDILQDTPEEKKKHIQRIHNYYKLVKEGYLKADDTELQQLVTDLSELITKMKEIDAIKSSEKKLIEDVKKKINSQYRD